MSKTVRRDLMEACQAKLMAWPGLLHVSVKLADRRPMAEAVSEQIRIFHESSSPERLGVFGAPIDWRTTLRFEVMGREKLSPEAPADDVADALVGEVFAAMQSDLSLSGKTIDIEPGSLITTEDDADRSVTSIQMLFTLVHRTQGNTIEV